MKTITTIIGLMLLTSCSATKEEPKVPGQAKAAFEAIQERFYQAQEKKEEEKYKEPEIEKTISLTLEKNDNTISLYLNNPNKQHIQSTRNWIAFPPQTLTISDLNLNTDIFDLAAPDEYKVDKENGIIKIGLSATQGTTEERIYIGSFKTIKHIKGMVPLSCYDYSPSTDSHCTVLGKENKNLLLEPEAILL